MATRSYTIVSHYSPPPEDAISNDDCDHKNVEAVNDDAEQEAIWRTGPLYKSRSAAADSQVLVSHRAAFPPNFVPAVLTQDDYLSPSAAVPSTFAPLKSSEKSELGSWYKSLRTMESTSAQSMPSTSGRSSPTGARLDSSDSNETRPFRSINLSSPNTQYRPHSHNILPIPSSSKSTNLPSPSSSRAKRKRPASDWFIRSALPKSNPPHTIPNSTSITDILTRNPPPPPGATPVPAKIRTKLGPGNKGYAMLASQGWKEGEGLGSWRKDNQRTTETETDLVNNGAGDFNVDEEQKNVEVIEVDSDGREIVDLTLLDSDSESDGGLPQANEDDIPLGNPLPPVSPALDSPLSIPTEGDRTVLLAPLKTYLKSDRLGIGAAYDRPSSSSRSSSNSHSTRLHPSSSSSQQLKPKPKPKPFTDTSQAMYSSKELREARRIKRLEELRNAGKSQRKRGSSGFANVTKEENQRRKDTLIYMNS